jgi:hypothetical protein
VNASSSGSLYELKPISALDLASGTSALMATDLAFYYGGLNVSVPKISWSLGRSWAPGLTVWPTFTSPLLPPGDTLVTISDYSVLPGAIFYDIVGVGDVAELAAAAVSGIATVAAMSVTLGGVEAAAGFAATEGLAAEALTVPELEADIAGRIGLDTFLIAA